ncbi:hypothetical protein ACFY8X_26375 [Streptomyces tanashiensis]|uniref:hypothetical protein n=1 Tax=Streptomyces tanashiensis TaxID=67367 RepID=UPI00167DFD33|nr:hypothetical protein [Streptomyces tanashiensis]
MSERIHHLTPGRLQDPEAGDAGLRDGERLPHVVLPGLRTPVRLVTRYEDVKAALTEPRLIREDLLNQESRARPVSWHTSSVGVPAGALRSVRNSGPRVRRAMRRGRSWAVPDCQWIHSVAPPLAAILPRSSCGRPDGSAARGDHGRGSAAVNPVLLRQ